MRRSAFQPFVASVLLMAIACCSPMVKAQQDQRPNIVVIMGDDWSWPHASCLGDQVVSTPTFDRIAKEGVLFANAFTSAPSCTSSRMAIASGQYQWRLGSAADLGGSIAASVPVYPDLLEASGYLTGFSRKGAQPSKHEFRKSDPFGKRYKNFDEFVKARKNGQPFCYWYGAGEPHRPYNWQSSKRSGMPLQKIALPKCLPDCDTVQTDVGDYYLRIQKLDRLAGKIVARLDQTGQLENTIIVMTGDNGMPFPRGKATLYDTGVRVPLAIRWGQNVEPNRTINDFVTLTDLAPTFLNAAGIAPPKSITGRSLIPQLTSKRSGWIDKERNTVLLGRDRHVLSRPSRAIRTKEYLYIRNFSPASWPNGSVDSNRPTYDFTKTPWPTKPPAFSHDVDPSPTKQWMLDNANQPAIAKLNALAFGVRPEEELYALVDDPHQLKNIVDSPEFSQTRQKLAKQMAREFHESGDPIFELASHSTFRVRGWRVYLNHQLWHEKPKQTKVMLDLLSKQLNRVEDSIPKKALQILRDVKIWINPPYEGVRPTAEYHGNRRWLKNNNRNVAMAKSIEITNVEKFEFENVRMPFLMLHELSHAYHDQALGFNNPKIREAFEAARDSGKYDSVRRFTGRKFIQDKAYAMSNPQEYFAESTEAYFGKNDFFPFNRKELESQDPTMADVIEELWGVKPANR